MPREHGESNPDAFNRYSEEKRVSTAFAVTKSLFEDSYDAESATTIDIAPHQAAEGLPDEQPVAPDDLDAVRYLEEFAVPLFRQYHDLPPHGSDSGGGRADAIYSGIKRVFDTSRELDATDSPVLLSYWQDRMKTDIGDTVPTAPGFHTSIDSNGYDWFYQSLQDSFEPDDFDQVVGIYSSGLPHLYTATSYLDAKEVVLRYSTVSRDDEEVMVTDLMADRQDFEGADILIVDDLICSGDTMRTVGEYVLDHGANSATAIAERGTVRTVQYAETGPDEPSTILVTPDTHEHAQPV